jgi:hypothetical protein
MAERESWLAVVQHGDDDHEQDTELVTLEGVEAKPGATIELTDGQRITLLEPAGAAA